MPFIKQRAVQGAPVTLRLSPVDTNGEPSITDPGTVTVGVVRADGTVLVAPGTATTVSGVDRTYTLTAANTALLDELTVTWTAGGVVIGRTTVVVVGAVFATLAEVRGIESATADVAENTAADMIRARGEVEAMFERACGGSLSFVPRYALRLVASSGSALAPPHYFIRSVRSVSYVNTSGAVTAADMTGGVQIYGGAIVLNNGWWPCGELLVGYEYGMDAPPLDVKRAAIQAVRRQVNLARAGVDSRAMSYTSPTGETQRFPTPGLGPWVTGIPEIDEVIADYRRRYPSLPMVA